MTNKEVSDRTIIELALWLELTCDIDENTPVRGFSNIILYSIKKNGTVIYVTNTSNNVHSWLLGYMKAKEIYQVV